MENKEILTNTDPEVGPLDGVQLKTECVRTKFIKEKKNNIPFVQTETTANVSASVETGTFSIRDLRIDVMYTVSIDEVMAVCAAAADANKAMQENQPKE